MSTEVLNNNALNILDISPIERMRKSPLLEQVEIIGTREGGLIDCWVPSELIDREEVPVKKEWAESLAVQMRQVAAAGEGGTGQLSPIILGLLENEDSLKIIDGFHRDAALKINGESSVYSTIQLTDWNGLYDTRIFTAKHHVAVRFSRVVQWMQEVWQHSGLSEEMTIEQAVLMYRFDTDGSRKGLDPIVVEAAKNWVKTKEEQWDIAAMTIYSHLHIAENVDPKLVHSARDKTKKLEAPTQIVLKIFADILPNNYEFQNLVMDTAILNDLKGPEVKAICLGIMNSESLVEAQTFIQDIDWDTWQPVYGRSVKGELRRAHDPRHKGAGVFKSVKLSIDQIIERVDQSLANKDEISDEMLHRIGEARGVAVNLRADLGSLIIKLSSLMGEETTLLEESITPAGTPAKDIRLGPDFGRKLMDESKRRMEKEYEIDDDNQGIPLVREGDSTSKEEPIRQDLMDFLMGKIRITNVRLPIPQIQLRRAWGIVDATASDITNWQNRFNDIQKRNNAAQD